MVIVYSWCFLFKDGKCDYNATNVESRATVTGYVEIKSEDEGALLDAVSTVGPVAVSVGAYDNAFMMYHRGLQFCWNDIDVLATNTQFFIGRFLENSKFAKFKLQEFMIQPHLCVPSRQETCTTWCCSSATDRRAGRIFGSSKTIGAPAGEKVDICG